MSRIPILVLDDQLCVRQVVAGVLKQSGFDVIEACDVAEAVQAINSIPELWLVITDLQVKGGTARDLIRHVERFIAQRRGTIMVITGAGTEDPRYVPYWKFFREHGITVFRKPFSMREVLIPHLLGLIAARGGP